MDLTTALLLGLGILALVVIAFFAVFHGKGKFKLKSKLGEVTAEGDNPTAIQSGVKTGNIQAGRDATVRSTATGGVQTGDVTAQGNATVEHTPGSPPPKT